MADKDNFETYKLDNGMEVILIPRPDSPATTVMVTVMVGSKYETKEISGLSHFMEHMAFKGTKKRPKPGDVAEELEGLGAAYNALTGQEKTAYYAKVRNKDFDQAFDIISDVYLNSTVPEEELEKERGVIIEEINMYEDLPMSKVQEDFIEVLYGDQPAGWPIAGRREVIEKATREEFMKFRETHYKSGNTILTIAGGYPEEGIKGKIEKTFGSLEEERETKIPEVVENQDKPAEMVRFKKSDQAHFIMGFRAFDAHDERKFALAVLSDVLGGCPMSSRLFKKIREEMGAAYYIFSGADLDTNSGVIDISAGVNIKKIDEVIKAALGEVKKLKEELVGDQELKKAKDHLAGTLFLALETSDRLASFYTDQRVRKTGMLTPEEISEKISKVTAEDVQSVANDLFVNEGLNLAVIGPFKNKSFLDILKV